MYEINAWKIAVVIGRMRWSGNIRLENQKTAKYRDSDEEDGESTWREFDINDGMADLPAREDLEPSKGTGENLVGMGNQNFGDKPHKSSDVIENEAEIEKVITDCFGKEDTDITLEEKLDWDGSEIPSGSLVGLGKEAKRENVGPDLGLVLQESGKSV